MNSESQQPQHLPEPIPKPPKPIVKKMRWPFPLIWIVPIAAAALAGYFLYQQHQEDGIEITIFLDDGAGIKPGETTLAYRGVTVGHVKTTELSDDHGQVAVHAQLSTKAAFLAKTQSLFWLVKPEVSLQSVTGLNTLVSGPYIDCQPGDGAEAHTFTGIKGPPKIIGEGLKIIASADSIGALSVDSPVNYRGIQVGIVKDIRLSSESNSVNVTLFIWDRYKELVRSNSQFWMLKGADLQGSLFSGVSLKLGSVQNLLTGGVAFATPEKNYGTFVREGTAFVLHDQPDEDWLKWKAKIALPTEENDSTRQKSAADADKKPMPALKHE